MQPVPLTFSGRNPIPDALEVFKGNQGVGAFGFGNELFGDVVVDPRLETMLTTRDFSEASFGGLGSLFLENGPSFLVPQAVFFHRLAGKNLSGGVGSDVDDAEIHAENVHGKVGFLFRNVADEVDEPLLASFGVDEIDFSLAEAEKFALMLATDEGDLHASGNRPKTDLIPFFKGKDPVVVGLGAPFSEDMEGGSVDFVGIRHLGDAPDDHLRRKDRSRSDFVILGLVQDKLPEGLCLESESGQVVAQGVAGFEGLEENLRLFVGRGQLEIDCYLHSAYSIFEECGCQPLTERRAHSSPA